MDLPLTIGGTIVGVLVVLSGLVRFFFSDSKAFDVLTAEVQMLREQQTIHATKIAAVETLYDQQRTEKHQYVNKYTRSLLLLGVIKTLAEQCACGVLENVRELIDRALEEAEEG